MKEYVCEVCGTSFSNQRALNAHGIAHKTGERYAVSRKKIPETFTCLNCGNQHKRLHSSTNQYCCKACQDEWKWKNITVPRVESGEISSHARSVIKKYLIEKHEERCSECGLGPEWNGKRLQLQIDHVDGNSDNNFPNNLRLLCPNCHTQTPTFGSKGSGQRYKKDTKRNTYIRKYRGKQCE